MTIPFLKKEKKQIISTYLEVSGVKAPDTPYIIVESKVKQKGKYLGNNLYLWEDCINEKEYNKLKHGQWSHIHNAVKVKILQQIPKIHRKIIAEMLLKTPLGYAYFVRRNNPKIKMEVALHLGEILEKEQPNMELLPKLILKKKL